MRQASKLRLGVAACLLTIVCSGRNSWAFDESTKTQALERYQEAKANWAEHRYCEAASGFNAALSVIPLPISALWAGHASARCGNLLAALTAYTMATQLTANELWIGDKQQQAQAQANDLLAALRVRIPKLVIDATALEHTQHEVTIDGDSLSPDKYGKEIPVNSGSHVVAYTRGGESHQERITIAEGKLRVLHLGRATPDDEGPVPAVAHLHTGRESSSNAIDAESPSTATPPAQALVQSERRYKAATVIAAVVGSAGIAAGVVTRLMAFHQKSIMDAHCDQNKFCDQTGMNAVDSASSLQNQSTVYLLIGVASVTTAIGLAIADANSSAGSVTAVVLPSGAGLGLQRNF